MDRPEVFVLGNPLYWEILIKDEEGLLLTTSAPSLSFRLNGATYSATSPSISANGTGRWKVELAVSGAVEGDIVEVIETISINSVTYNNPWACTALSPESGADTGTGLIDFTITVQDSEAEIIPSATVYVYTDSGAYTGIKGVTSSLGIITFRLDPGTYQFGIGALNGYDTHIAEEYEVSEELTSASLTITASTEVETELDTSGIRRVKTKHMEVEAWDPKIIQDARIKESTPLPSFCSLSFCKGQAKSWRRNCN